jgi:hypothetical protein
MDVMGAAGALFPIREGPSPSGTIGAVEERRAVDQHEPRWSGRH